MKDWFFKLLPLAAGALLGWLLFAAPEWLAALGPLRVVVAVALVAVLLVGFVAVQVLASLPADVGLAPVDDRHPAEMADLVGEYQRHGFRHAGTYRVAVAPPAVLAALVHEDGRSYGTVFRTGTLPAKTSCDVVSILQGGRGGLTTGPDAAGGTLPPGPGTLRQFFPGASVAELADRHQRALAWLAGQGLPARPVSAGAFQADFKMALARQRRDFLTAPVRNTVVAIWRAATRRVPNLAPLEQQAEAQRQVRDLLTGTRS